MYLLCSRQSEEASVAEAMCEPQGMSVEGREEGEAGLWGPCGLGEGFLLSEVGARRQLKQRNGTI